PPPSPYQWFSAWMLRAEKAIARNKIHSGIFAVCLPTWQTGIELMGNDRGNSVNPDHAPTTINTDKIIP
ncbi:MAG: hypothetical protein OEU74_06265, partial [Gammaproteobacteria bacterium]|nr:hypothetical protein [Gammaproteobacteria bacterium]